MNNLVLFLPHGYEGQGPEHSSARMERFLELSANNNIQVTQPTTPANMFHLLRRQVKMDMRLPLIVFTPKSLLRHSQVSSTIEDLEKGTFEEVLDDPVAEADLVEKVVFVSGRLYYDLSKYKLEKGISNVALVRVEQIFPIPDKQIDVILKKYKKAAQIIWAQDEPENMGPWPFINRKMGHLGFSLISRAENASPAAGLMEQYKQTEQKIMEAVFEEKETVAS
jgi:2-oxoglutarate dehydrogenase E1 component